MYLTIYHLPFSSLAARKAAAVASTQVQTSLPQPHQRRTDELLWLCRCLPSRETDELLSRPTPPGFLFPGMICRPVQAEEEH